MFTDNKARGGTEFSDGAVLLYRRAIGELIGALLGEMNGRFFRIARNHIRACDPKSIEEHKEKTDKVHALLDELWAKYPKIYTTPLYKFEAFAMQNIDLAIGVLYRLRTTIEDGSMLKRVAVEEIEIPETANEIIDKIKALM